MEGFKAGGLLLLTRFENPISGNICAQHLHSSYIIIIMISAVANSEN